LPQPLSENRAGAAARLCIASWETFSTEVRLAETELHVWKISLNPVLGPRPLTAALLSPDEIARAERIRRPDVRQRFIAARAGLRRVLAQYLGCHGNEIRLRYGEQGKPEIDDPQTRIHFNLSHAADLALLAVSTQGPVGIDLEPIAWRPHVHAIAARMFQPAVARRLRRLQGEMLILEFLRAWTALEARAKCLGQGLFRPPPAADGQVRIEHFQPTAGFIAALACVPSPPAGFRLRYLALHTAPD